jgi:phospholipid/cholesterol/gamma-HCH transport system ATP-binding protein
MAHSAEGTHGEAIVEFHDVHKTFGSNRVLRGIDLRIPEGKITFVIGRSGEGKSVTIKHIVGILKPDRGRVVFDGKDMTEAGPREWEVERRKIGLLFQDGALFDSLSVAENVAFALREDGTARMGLAQMNARVVELLAKVGLPGIEDKFPPELSIGEKKRVGLARALALDPKLLLYDEPTTGMDSLVSELIDNLIVDMQAKTPGLSSVVISHDVRSILKVAESIVFLHEGRIYMQGTPDEFRRSEDPVIKQFLTGSPRGPLSRPIA